MAQLIGPSDEAISISIERIKTHADDGLQLSKPLSQRACQPGSIRDETELETEASKIRKDIHEIAADQRLATLHEYRA